MAQALSITPNPAQMRWLDALMTKTWAKAFIFCGGYGVGKSFFDVLHILWLVKKYEGTPITIGVGSSTMKRLRQTLLLDLTTMLKQAHIKFSYDKMEGQMQIGTTTIIIINLELYEEIFGFNLHCCISGDTLIQTDNGPKRMDCIASGDMVLTRNGYRPVKKAWCNGIKTVTRHGCGAVTPGHQVAVKRNGQEIFVQKELTEFDELVILDIKRYTKWQTAKSLILTESGIGDTRTAPNQTGATIFGLTAAALRTIRLSMKVFMEKHQKDSLSTISTITPLTTTFLTLNALQSSTISLTTTMKKETALSKARRITGKVMTGIANRFVKIAAERLPEENTALTAMNVIPPQNAVCYSENLTEHTTSLNTLLQNLASIAKRNLTLQLNEQSSAVKSALTLTDTLTDKPLRKKTVNTVLAKYAAKLLKLLTPVKQLLAPTLAALKNNDKLCSVYDLQVDGLNTDEHEFCFADGTLVHNCILDEADTLPVEKALGAFQKCTERTRIKFPDGREPYLVISSTANGLKGVYMIYNKLKDQWKDDKIPQDSKVPFIYMTGATYENPYFAKTTLELLKALYNDKEKEAFIEGRFVNLAVGRVYPEFDHAANVHMDFPVNRKDVVYIGMDFNQGFNSNVALVNKQGTLHVVKEFKCTYAGDVPRMARELFPENEIIMIPDASGKEILRGYLTEMEEYGLELRIPIKNPGISERILCINKLFRMKRLYVHQSCKEVIRGLEVRGWDENTGEPEKGRGEGAVDHYCDGLEYSLHYIINNDNIHFEALLELLKFQGNEQAGKSKFLTREGLGKYVNHSTNTKEMQHAAS